MEIIYDTYNALFDLWRGLSHNWKKYILCMEEDIIWKKY